jgi:hypothetical protein
MSIVAKVLSSPGIYLKPIYWLNFIGGRLFKYWRKVSFIIPSDEFYLRIYYRLAMQKNLDLKNPSTFTEKIQWLKLYNTDPGLSRFVDKYLVREIVKVKIGSEYLIPLLGVWDTFDEIDFETLPNKFVLKTNHDSGSVIICRNKTRLDYQGAKIKLNKALRQNYFYYSREYPYKFIIPKIIAEEIIGCGRNTSLADYKFFCFHGQPKILLVVTQHNGLKYNDYFDIDLNHLPFTTGFPNSPVTIVLPDNINVMIDIATVLCAGFLHVRIDLYNVDGKIYFGEYTFHHGGGLSRFAPQIWDEKIGDLLHLPN